LFFQDDELLKARYEMLQVRINFYLQRCQQYINNFHQENLEMITEKLTQSIDKQHDQISGPEIRKLTTVANTALKNLLSFEEAY
jgi:ATP sulfurylase